MNHTEIDWDKVDDILQEKADRERAIGNTDADNNTSYSPCPQAPDELP